MPKVICLPHRTEWCYVKNCWSKKVRKTYFGTKNIVQQKQEQQQHQQQQNQLQQQQ